MDTRIVQSLQASLQPETQAEAEKLLIEMHKIIDFGPTLLKIVVEPSLDLPVRQSGAVFLKNMILKSWKERAPSSPDEPIPFQIHENDKKVLREMIVPAVAASALPIQSILRVAVGKIVKCDFPANYPGFVEQVGHYLNMTSFREFHGALVCLYSIAEVYEHRTSDRGQLPQTMGVLLHLVRERMTAMLEDVSDESLMLQKLILKIFYRYTNYYLQPTSINEEWVTQWHVLICAVLENFNGASDDADSVYWKRQKWASRILHSWFTTYGSPGNVQKKYEAFADWYLKSFTTQVLTVFFKICDAYCKQTFVSPIVLAEILSYFSAALCHAFSWKTLKPNFDVILRDLIVPLMSHTPELAEMWSDDPLEYIRYNNTLYMTTHSASDAAATLIKDACSKRKGILDKSMQYCMQVLASDAKPELKDGALNIVGTVYNTLLKTKAYKQQLETFVTTHVLPLFEAPEGFRRSRAAWLVGKLSGAKFNNATVLVQTAMACRQLMSADRDLPVRVAAANAIFSLIKDQEEVKNAMGAHLPELVMELLKLLRETEFDDLNTVLRDIMVSYTTEIQPIALQMLQHLSETFVKMVGVQENGSAFGAGGDAESGLNDEMEYQALVATGIMENIESLLSVMEDEVELMATMEPVIVQLVQIIFKHKVSDFYDEAFSLVCSLTCTKISPLLWTVFDWLCEAYGDDASDCFSAMMPALHNYVTVDPTTFVASPERVKMLTAMCGKTLQCEDDDDSECVHAAKLLEVMAINFRGQLDNCIPEFVELALTRLTKQSTSVELRMMCLQVVIAAIVSSSAVVLPILSSHMWPGTQTPIIENFLKIWMENIKKFTGLHDRRVCVLGICTLLSLSADQRPPAVDAIANQYLPAILHLLTALQGTYTERREAQEDGEDDDDDETEEDGIEGDGENDAQEDDDDIIDEAGAKYLELLEAVEADLGDSDDDDEYDDEDDFEADSMMEEYDTELDKEDCEMEEYVTFYNLMKAMETNDTAWYSRLVAPLTETEKSNFEGVTETALKCIGQKQSKQIEKAGGYTFQHTAIPNNFNFSSDPSSNA